MLTISGTRGRRACDGVSRRDFLRIGTLGAGGLSLADLLRLRAQASQPARPRSVIMVYLAGGPSHIDMYDLKPDAPAEFRGEFRPIHTNVPGFDICELMPQQARMADKFAVIRSLRYKNDINGHLLHELTTGADRTKVGGELMPARPPLGAVVSKLRGWAGGMPPNIAMGGTGGLGNPYDPLYLGLAHQPFSPSGQVGQDLRPSRGLSAARIQDRRALLGSFDTLRHDLDSRDTMAGVDDFNRQALDMVVSGKVRDALDLDREPERVRQRYNPEPRSNTATGLAAAANCLNLLLARRLVEAGVSVVSVCYYSGLWDTHGKNFTTLRGLLPKYDHGISALVDDLAQRGLDQEVAVVVWGEFGRSPKIAYGEFQGGRNHWPEVGFALLAGGGWKMGQVIGTTDARGERPRTNPYTPENVLATVYRHLDIDLDTTLTDPAGRPQYLLDDREPIRELL
jgi:uncharacterized protein (DUF1501 family)